LNSVSGAGTTTPGSSSASPATPVIAQNHPWSLAATSVTPGSSAIRSPFALATPRPPSATTTSPAASTPSPKIGVAKGSSADDTDGVTATVAMTMAPAMIALLMAAPHRFRLSFAVSRSAGSPAVHPLCHRYEAGKL
jgi:hypothetical protein